MSVLNLSDFRKKPIVEEAPRGPDKERLWFCTTCKGDRFHLDLDSNVWCARCVAWIKNLSVKA